MRTFEAFYLYSCISCFMESKYNIMAMCHSEGKFHERKLRDWNKKHFNTDGILFDKILKRFDNEKELLLLFLAYYIKKDNCHPATILKDEYTSYHSFIAEINTIFMTLKNDWIDMIETAEFHKLDRKKFLFPKVGQSPISNKGPLSQAIFRTVFASYNEVPNNPLEKEFFEANKYMADNIWRILAYCRPTVFEVTRFKKWFSMILIPYLYRNTL